MKDYIQDTVKIQFNIQICAVLPDASLVAIHKQIYVYVYGIITGQYSS